MLYERDDAFPINKYKAMKTLILSFLFIIGLAAPNIGKPINDIYSVKEPVFKDEAYVNDIPFNTYEIAVGVILEGDELELEEEAYVNDIPFDTRAIASKFMLLENLETSDEFNVNDIPFNTEKIFYEKLLGLLSEQYRDELGAYDIPELPEYSLCCYEIKIPRNKSVLFGRPLKIQ